MNKFLLCMVSVLLFQASLWGQEQDFRTPADQNVIKVMGQAHYQELDPHNIGLLSWNIHKGKDELFLPTFKSLSAGKELILIQEVFFYVNAQNRFEDYSLGQWTFAQSFSYSMSGDQTGVATISRAKPAKVQFVRTQVTEPVTFTPKMSLLTWFKLKGLQSQLLVANVHGINFVADGDYRKEMLRIKDAISKHTGPVILAGDFNSWNRGRIQALFDVVSNLGLKAVTFTPDYRKLFMGNYIDHIFYRGLSLKSSTTLKTDRASDHNAVSAEFSAVASY